MRNNPEILAGLASLIALLALGALVFAPGIASAEFLNFDDNLFFVEPDNAPFRAAYDDGDLGALLDPSRTIANAYLPVSHLSLWFDYAMGRQLGLGAALPRWHSLILHVLAAFALARLLGRLGLARLPATAAAAVFLVHPAVVESVAWVSSRKDVLCGLFSFMCLSAVADQARRPAWSNVVMAAIWASLALYSKGTAVVLLLLAPVVAALIGGGGKGRWLAIPPVVCLVVAAGLHHTAIAAGQGTLQETSVADRLVQVPGALAHYLRVTFWPHDLNVLYPEVVTIDKFTSNLWVSCAALVGALGVVLVACRRRAQAAPGGGVVGVDGGGRRGAAAGVAMAMLALAPFNTAWPASSIAAADRYLYLVVPWAAMALVAALPGPRGGWVALALVLPLSWCSADRVGDFSSSRALWESSLDAEPSNAVARINLGMAVLRRDPDRARSLVEAAVTDARLPQHRVRAEVFLRDLAWRDGRFEEASLHAERACAAVEALPEGPVRQGLALVARLKLATVLLLRGEDDAARRAVAVAAKIAPGDPAVLAYRASMMLRDAADPAGRVAVDAPAWRGARDLLDQALEASPEHFEANLARARWDRARGAWMSALRYLRRARAADPSRPESYLAECELFLENDDYAAAETAARQGLASAVHEPNLLVRLGQSLAGQGRLDDAREHYQRFLAERPGDLGARRALAAVLVAEIKPSMFQESPEALEQAARRIHDLEPENGHAWLFRGLAERMRRKLAAALVCFERARAAAPDSEDALDLLAKTHRDRGYELLRDPQTTSSALDHFRAFVDLNAPGVDTRAAVDVLRSHWLRIEKIGTEAFREDDFEAAERAFRRCLEIVPEQTSAHLQLGLALLELGDQEEALASFEAAERGQRDSRLDASMPVLYQVLTLQRLGRADEARQRGQKFLDDPTPARPQVIARIREAISS